MQEDWDAKEAICIWFIQTHSKKIIMKGYKRETKERKIQPEIPNCVYLENWDCVQLPDNPLQ